MASDLTDEVPATQPALDPGVLRVIRSSADQLIQREDTFARQLRYDIATLMPDLVTRLDGEGLPFCQRLVRTMLWVAVYDQPPHVIAGVLHQAGARNWLEGFPEGQYVSVAHALVRTVRDLSEDDWSTSMGSAWISYFMWIKPYLLAGAELAAAQQTAQGAQQAGAQGAQQAGAQQAGAQQAGAYQAGAQQPTARQGAAGLEAIGLAAARSPAAPFPAAPFPAAPFPAAPSQAAQPRTDPLLSDQPQGGQLPPAQPHVQAAQPHAPGGGDLELEPIADLLDDEDEDDGDVGYGQIMVSMTRGPRRERSRPPD